MINSYIVQVKDMKLEVQVIRSNRKTVTLEVKKDATINVRIPNRYSDKKAIEIIEKNKIWVLKKYLEQEQRKEREPNYSEQDVQKYRELARKKLTAIANYYAEIMDVSFNKIYIREQKTCWGSCSAKRNLNFNWKLILFPEQAQEYVVVHELAHLKHMNHSKDFWNEVEKVFPDYKEREKFLKK